MLYVHRLAWLYVHGEWPTEQIDHINQNPVDNRIANLRPADKSQNVQNIDAAYGSSGYRGVSFDSRCGDGNSWRARIMVDGKSHSLGYYATAEEAHDAYLAAKRELHPFWVERAA